MTPLETLQAIDAPPVSVVALTVVALALVVSEPVLGRREHRAFLAELAADTAPAAQESVRVRLYRQWSRQGWAFGVAAVLLVVALPGVGPAELGLRAPDLGRLLGADGGSLTGSTLAGFLVGATLAVVASTLLVRILARRSMRTPIAGAAAIEPMLPRSPRGRRGWAGLALAAGVTEEVTYRGLLILTIALLAPGADRTAVLVAAAVLFGVAHWYQGPLGMLATGAIGFVLGGLYLSTGSLLVPMVLHTLVDLRPLLLPAPRPIAAPGVGAPGEPAPAVTTDAPGTSRAAAPPAAAPSAPAPSPTAPGAAHPHDAPVTP
ncbi:CPBP family intramembrane glutamic endopeptidase [Cellulomonas sp. NS3]|uniref:CPBP family intramembrane glutamic endopeptidase n=1 Tax=Cellulomonas sp. NS3 TaxID=2973977 RepID=UPI002163BBEA|nr:CPBP family intramembrane glutamic endopeptidase [Cellulomonas sp. NS3]